MDGLRAKSWATAHQAPLSMGFSRQEHWSGLAFPSPGDLPDPGIEPMSLMSPTLAGRYFTTLPPWEATPSYGLANSMSSIFSVHPECNHFSPPLLPVLWSQPQVSSKVFDLYFETDENYLLIEPLLTLFLHPWLLKAYSTR